MKYLISFIVILALAYQTNAQYNGTCGGVSFNSSSVCNGRGNCTAFDTCNCNTNYFGYLCDSFNCGSTLFNSSTVCGGQGKCNAPNTCACNAGYTGSECKSWMCNNVANTDPASCSGLAGNCTAPNTCACNPGYFGHTCEAFNCGGLAANATGVCSGKGLCLAPNRCVCAPGVTGTNCESFVAPQKCRTTVFVKDTWPCSNTANPRFELNTTNVCPQTLTCDPADSKCRKTPAFGTACTANSNCTSTFFPLATASLTCINNKCGYKKHFGLACTANNECRTGLCVSNKCAGNLPGQACSPSLAYPNPCVDIGNGTQSYCNAMLTPPTCVAKGKTGAACITGTCEAGLECAASKCRPTTAVDKAACNPTQANACQYKGLVPVGLSCYPTTASTGTCGYPGKGVLNSLCLTGAQCGAGFGCQGGKCVDAATVNCADASSSLVTNPAAPCGSGLCDCSAGGNFAVGKCSKLTGVADAQACAATLGPLVQCLIAKCPGDLSVINPFDWQGGNCGTQCATEVIVYGCCIEKAMGANFVPFTAGVLPPYSCAAPTVPPTAAPSVATPTNKPGASLSSASKTVASLFVVALSAMLF